MTDDIILCYISYFNDFPLRRILIGQIASEESQPGTKRNARAVMSRFLAFLSPKISSRRIRSRERRACFCSHGGFWHDFLVLKTFVTNYWYNIIVPRSPTLPIFLSSRRSLQIITTVPRSSIPTFLFSSKSQA